jgi:hypothetical protein
MSISESESEHPSSESYDSDDDTTSGYSNEPQKPPPFPQTIQNWWLSTNLGSGYSGMLCTMFNFNSLVNEDEP